MSSQVRQRLSRAQARAQTRQRLVDAAMRVFAREGDAGASVNAIAEQAGYTAGALYSNLPTQDEVVLPAFGLTDSWLLAGKPDTTTPAIKTPEGHPSAGGHP